LFEVRWRGGPITIAPKAFDTLAFLIRNQHRVVTKPELLANVWKGSCVTDDALGNAIRKARQALAQVRSAETIETVRGRGYRFKAAKLPRSA